MSPARRHRDKFAAAKAPETATAAAPAEAGEIVLQGVREKAIEDLTPAARHRLKHLGVAAAAAIAAAPAAANDNSSAGPDPEAANPAYQLMLLQLGEHMRELKQIQSVEAKCAHKAQILPTYADYVAGVLQASAAAGVAPDDQVVAHVLVWMIDAGRYAGALDIARHMLRFSLPLPERYERTLPTLITEEISEGVLRGLSAGAPSAYNDLVVLGDLVTDEDMPDEVRAKYFKALGLTYVAAAANDTPADGETEHSIARMKRSALGAAEAALARALQLNDKAGCKKDLERVQRELKALEDKTGEDPPA